MNFVMSPAWFVVTYSLFFLWMPVCMWKRHYAVSGTLKRYRWNTIERIVRWPAAVYISSPLLKAFLADNLESRVVFIFSFLVCMVIYVWCWRMARDEDRDDDDDWFSKTGRRLKRWVRSLRPVRTPAPEASRS